MKISNTIFLVLLIIIVIVIGGYFGARYYFSLQYAPEYFYMHPTLAKIFGVTPVCSTVCVAGGGVCGKDGKNYCNQCIAFQHGAGYAHDGACVKPTSDPTGGWNVVNNSEFGFSLKYPNNFFDTGHEPKILTGACTYSLNNCSEIPDVIAENMQGGDADIKMNWITNGVLDVAGQTININNASYLLCQTSDAGMGHVYNYYYYVTVKNDKCLVVNFDTSATNCSAYLPLEKGNTQQVTNYNNCITKNKNQPIILNEVVNTFNFK